MKQNDNGFVMSEIIASFSIFLTIMLTFTPIMYQIVMEEKLMEDRRNLQSLLHDELQIVLSSDQGLPLQEKQTISSTLVTFTFTIETKYIKGCVRWDNEKQTQEKICLYGIPN
ncbi:hypothetical protein NC661_01185 [Aquibacillus koreensis]|uniref:Uncharacterized protein n=1 Tax=Aquibacillus koreensis TaxID=279446 RepID=A0A9X3WKX4_9BACI|nr:hypothetical protein [Aquibacillus koreensis]MCT2537550.1 hypothetical protein [Aquibacillus koreensis]MDC3418996.1 hypothetical protein [Aquibacillus koreensis]